MFLKDYYPKLNKKFVKHKFNGIAFDSNLVKKDYIFFAIKGNNLDGNKFVKDAIKKGSKIIISEKIKGTNIDTSYIMEQEIEKLVHKFAIDSVYILQAYLPQILEGVASDLRLKLDEKYKKEILNGENSN